ILSKLHIHSLSWNDGPTSAGVLRYPSPVYSWPVRVIARFLTFICATTFAFCLAMHGQPRTTSAANAAVVPDLGPDTIALDRSWKFHTGDDTAWAQPNFDDANWESIDIARPWGDQGHWSYGGRAWYRRAIQWTGPSDAPYQLGLYIPETACAYEIYW